MKNEDIFKVMESQHRDTIKLIEANKTAINAETKASADMINLRLDQVMNKQDITNGRVNSLDDECDKTVVFKNTLKYKLIGVLVGAIILTIALEELGILEFLKLIK